MQRQRPQHRAGMLLQTTREPCVGLLACGLQRPSSGLTCDGDLVSRLAGVHVCVKGVHQQAAGCLALRDVGGVLLHLDDLCRDRRHRPQHTRVPVSHSNAAKGVVPCEEPCEELLLLAADACGSRSHAWPVPL